MAKKFNKPTSYKNKRYIIDTTKFGLDDWAAKTEKMLERTHAATIRAQMLNTIRYFELKAVGYDSWDVNRLYNYARNINLQKGTRLENFKQFNKEIEKTFGRGYEISTSHQRQTQDITRYLKRDKTLRKNAPKFRKKEALRNSKQYWKDAEYNKDKATYQMVDWLWKYNDSAGHVLFKKLADWDKKGRKKGQWDLVLENVPDYFFGELKQWSKFLGLGENLETMWIKQKTLQSSSGGKSYYRVVFNKGFKKYLIDYVKEGNQIPRYYWRKFRKLSFIL